MTIEDASTAPWGGDDLIHHMREVHAEAAKAATGPTPPETHAPLEEVEPASLEHIDGVDAADPVQRRLMETARCVLNGDFEGDVQEVRASVVDEIFDEDWKGRLPADRREAIGGAVRDALTGDLAFRTEVDHMLLHAARMLGRAG